MKAPLFPFLLALAFVLSPSDLDARIRFTPPSLIAVGDRPLRLQARGGPGIRFTSNKPRIARINGNRIRAVRPGNARITATSSNGQRASRRITVGSRARVFGSSLANAPNLLVGPEWAPIYDPIFGNPVFTPSGQASCTFRHAGIIGNLNPTSVVPATGIIRNVRVRCGANPSPMQVVIMSGSPGLYGTAIRTSAAFRPRANAITTVPVNLRVTRSLHGTSQITDAVALNILGPGTAPLFDQGNGWDRFLPGSALLQHWYPILRPGVPENERAYAVGGIELLMQWEFIQIGSGITR